MRADHGSPITFYVVSRIQIEELRKAAESPPFFARGSTSEVIRRSLQAASVQYTGHGDYLATAMAYLDDNDILVEADMQDLRESLELHLGGRLTFYEANAEQRSRVDPKAIAAKELQAYWEDEQFAQSEAGEDIRSAIGSLHQALASAGDDSMLLVHW